MVKNQQLPGHHNEANERLPRHQGAQTEAPSQPARGSAEQLENVMHQTMSATQNVVEKFHDGLSACPFMRWAS